MIEYNGNTERAFRPNRRNKNAKQQGISSSSNNGSNGFVWIYSL